MKTIQAWVARDKQTGLWLSLSKPFKHQNQWLTKEIGKPSFRLNDSDFPNVKWEDKEPTKVEITIKVKQHEQTRNTNS